MDLLDTIRRLLIKPPKHLDYRSILRIPGTLLHKLLEVSC